MARMVRKQIVIDAAREAALERIAAERGTSQSEVIRQAIDLLVEEMQHADARQKAFDELLHMSERLQVRGVRNPDGTRSWTREELYERGSR
jgi:Arc/MetJ-type ribon-helix-helix transcriptional regulator